MPGTDPGLTPLETRKQLLIVESELNRAQIMVEWQAMTEGVRGFTDRVKSAGPLASIVALFAAGVTAFRRGKAAPAGAKQSWFTLVLKGAQLANSIWSAFRAKPAASQQDKP